MAKLQNPAHLSFIVFAVNYYVDARSRSRRSDKRRRLKNVKRDWTKSACAFQNWKVTTTILCEEKDWGTLSLVMDLCWCGTGSTEGYNTWSQSFLSRDVTS